MSAGRCRASCDVRLVFVTLLLLLVLSALAAVVSGKYPLPLVEAVRILASRVVTLEQSWTKRMEDVVLLIRLPRIVGAMLVGGALALAGGAYQGVFKNPLVSPDLLGVSAGAGVGASFAILMHWPGWCIQVGAFCGGILAAGMAISLPRLMRNRTILMLVLSGVIVTGFMSAVQGILKYVADSDSELPSIVYWLMGSLNDVKRENIGGTAPVILIAMAVLLAIRWRINLLSLNDIEARSLGVDVHRLRRVAILCATVLTASAVCLAGNIGWVGLIVPHLARLLVGEDNRYSLPASVLLGACFMVVVDTLTRTLTSEALPLSILTGLVGAPLFVAILIRKRVSIE